MLRQRIRLAGLELDAIAERDVVAEVVASRPSGGWVCPVNLDVLRQASASPETARLVAEADLVVADGMPLIWASRLQGTPLPERVAGSSLIMSVPTAASAAGRSLFLLGGNPGAADGAAKRLRELHPELKIVGTLCPPMGFERDPSRLDEIEAELSGAQPDIVFVGLGFPKQERLIVRLRPTFPGTWFISCGISFSFVSGEVRRAPPILQRIGLEWVHRLVQEPRRLCKRYLVDGLPFVLGVFFGAIRRRMTASRAHLDGTRESR